MNIKLFNNLLLERMYLRQERTHAFKVFGPFEKWFLILFFIKFCFSVTFQLYLSNYVRKLEVSKEILFFSGTFNQKKSLSIVFQNLERNVQKKVEKVFLEANENQVLFCLSDIYFFARIIFRSKLFYQYTSTKFISEANARRDLYHALMIYTWYRILSNADFKLVVVANCHNDTNSALLQSSKILKIKTCFVQHAIIRDKYSGQLLADFNFLAGLHCLSVVKSHKQIDFKVSCISGLVGIDSITACNKRETQRGYIGVAPSLGDDICQVFVSIDMLINAGHRVLLRLHPREPETRVKQVRDWLSLKRVTSVSLSSTDLTANQFIRELKLMLVCRSSIALEAAAQGVPTVYVDWDNRKLSDVYQFVLNKCVVYCECHNDLNETVENILKDHDYRVNKEGFNFYCAGLGDRSGEMINRSIASDIEYVFQNVVKG